MSTEAEKNSAELAKRKTMTYEDWHKRGTELYGANHDKWVFACPACGHEQSLEGVISRNPAIIRDEAARWIYFACEGRHNHAVGCNWTLGGLFHFHELEITMDGDPKGSPAFRFAADPAGMEPFYTPAENPNPTKKKPHAKKTDLSRAL